MTYLYNTSEDRQAMFSAIGIQGIGELFDAIPSELRLTEPLDLPGPFGELALTQHLSSLAEQNLHAENCLCFLGGGSYDHFVPAVVDAIASRGEFFTSYTPYQPEVSQGNLQVMFEYQTLICQLTGMDVSNASLYDGGSALAEAVLMSMSVTKRLGRVVVPRSLHPEFRGILATYLANLDTELITVDDLATEFSWAEAVDFSTACVVVQNPNFLGAVEDVQEIGDVAHRAGALLIVLCDPISLGLLRRPGDMGADIVVAEGQSLGTPPSFGGPYLGILACHERFVRRMPGRIAGQTVDRRGKRCWVLTLQTREQHIRRDKATSNICTNQGLFALRASVYLSALGPQGLRSVAELCTRKAHYAHDLLVATDRFEILTDRPFFKEFVVRDRHADVSNLLNQAARRGVLAGVPLGKWYEDMADCFLVAVTEKRTKADIDRWAETLTVSTGEFASNA